jgi:hypothetical protein
VPNPNRRIQIHLHVLVGVAVICSSIPAAWAQLSGVSSSPNLGAAGGQRLPSPSLLNATQNSAKRHLMFGGKSCLEVRGIARPRRMKPNSYDHVISITNRCPQPIKTDVCYYQTQHCISLPTPGYAHSEDILGSFPAMSYFRFEYRERFD